MIHVFAIWLLIAASLVGAAAPPQRPRVLADDLQRLTGARWEGTLTYLDYGKNREVSLPSQLVVTREGGAGARSSWTFEYSYPEEPRANGKKTVALGEDGGTLGGEPVVERTKMPDGTLKIVTESKGTDNDKPSRNRLTYLLGAGIFSIRKDVLYEGAAGYFRRNEYNWKR